MISRDITAGDKGALAVSNGCGARSALRLDVRAIITICSFNFSHFKVLGVSDLEYAITKTLIVRMGKKKTHVSKIHNHGGGPPWSELNHDVLFLVMMDLGVIDFLSFSRRSFALANKIRFMASKPPMELLLISEQPNNTKEYSLVDFGGRSFKIILPESGGRDCVGLTCGYLILLGRKSCDFLLMNPITRHGIRFPPAPGIKFYPLFLTRGVLRAVLVFSSSTFTWVLVGKIYAIDNRSRLYEVALDPCPKLMLLKTKNILDSDLMVWEFVSSGENLYAMDCFSRYECHYKIHKLDFGEMKWMSKEENTTKDHVFFVSQLTYSAAIRQGLWSEFDSWLHHKYKRSANMCINAGVWYFPHDCLKSNAVKTQREGKYREWKQRFNLNTWRQLFRARRLARNSETKLTGPRMGKRRSVSKSKNRVYGGPWSDLNHDLLTLVLMKLEAIDFRSFSGVCKSWRSLALPHKSMFMASRPPMALSKHPNEKKEYSLQDLGGNIFKIRFPKIGERACAGVTCGYLVFFTFKPRDFLLMNPITRHAIRFPKVPRNLAPYKEGVRAILVFSPSRSAWVFVLLCRFECEIWFSIAGKGEWDNVSVDSGFIDVHEFKGKIYAIDHKYCLYELIIDPEPVLMLLNNTNLGQSDFLFRQFVSSGEDLYAMESYYWLYEYKFYKLDFGEMKWVSPEENSTEDCAFFVTDLKHSAAIKPGLWSESDYWSRFQNRRYEVSDTCGKNMFFKADIWYFPHDSLKANFWYFPMNVRKCSHSDIDLARKELNHRMHCGPKSLFSIRYAFEAGAT
ncbi:hypothetical protein LXL04_010474 [Taraxacum kok-saghyz]